MKLMLAVLVLAMVGLSVATDCGVMDRLIVKRQWSVAFGNGDDRSNFALDLWRDFFGNNPDARAFFGRVEGDDEFSDAFMAHAHRVLGGLDMCISLLDDEATLDAELAHLRGQHDARGIGAENYTYMKSSLAKVLADKLGRNFDKHAWGTCYDLIVSGISG